MRKTLTQLHAVASTMEITLMIVIALACIGMIKQHIEMKAHAASIQQQTQLHQFNTVR